MDSETRPKRIVGVVLDAVGTLIEASPPVTEAYVTAALRQGIALDRVVVWQRFQRAFLTDESRERDGPLTTTEALEHHRWRRIVAEVLPELPDQERGLSELWDHFGRPESWRCFPDVAPFMRILTRSGVHVRIASNFDARLRSVFAGLPELAEFSKDALLSSEVGFRKPSRDFYRSVLTSLGTDPDATLWIGDDPENDVLGPRRLGFQSVHLDRKGTTATTGEVVPDLQALADALLDSGALGL
jgi:putative hydrolase of the HAD superfamily